MKKKNSFAVIGCGRFGGNLAKTLAQLGSEVLVVDKDENTVNELAEYVTYAVQADVGHEGALDEIGLHNVDTAVIATSSNFEASVMATAICKEKGITSIIAKAKSEKHARILEQVGADRTILPEKDMGIRLGHSLSSSAIFDYIELDTDYSIVELIVPKEWVGKSLQELDIRQKYQVNVIGILNKDYSNINPSPSDVFIESDRLLILGSAEKLLEIEGLQ